MKSLFKNINFILSRIFSALFNASFLTVGTAMPSESRAENHPKKSA
jgi:hypothetical protein